HVAGNQSDFGSARLSSTFFLPLLISSTLSATSFFTSSGILASQAGLTTRSPEPSAQVNHFGSVGASKAAPVVLTFHHWSISQLICGSHLTIAEATIDFGATLDMST